MRKRIVKITYKDNSVIYRCERTGFFMRNTWRPMTIQTEHGGYEAVFSSLKDAKSFLGVDDSQQVASCDTVWEGQN